MNGLTKEQLADLKKVTDGAIQTYNDYKTDGTVDSDLQQLRLLRHATGLKMQYHAALNAHIAAEDQLNTTPSAVVGDTAGSA